MTAASIGAKTDRQTDSFRELVAAAAAAAAATTTTTTTATATAAATAGARNKSSFQKFRLPT